VKKLFEATLELPPSSNNIYFNRRGGGRSKTSEAVSYERRAVGQIVRQGDLDIQKRLDPNAMYFLGMYFYFPLDRVCNKGWFEFWKKGKNKGKRKAETKWKQMDLGNRTKLLEDCVKSACGVDDSATFWRMQVKDIDDKNPRVVISLYQIMEHDPCPMTKP
jgi:Holliday junction resolvase RusA-like endonuclease